jgi:C-terminal peptidase prc
MKFLKIAFLIFLCISCQYREKPKNENLILFDKVLDIINKNYYDPNFNGVNWKENQETYRAKIKYCKNTDSFFCLLNEMLFELNSSHCGIGLLSEIEKNASPYIFSKGQTGLDIRILDNQIVVTKVLKNSAADRASIKTGFIIEKINGLSLSDIEENVKFRPPFNVRNEKYHLTAEVLRKLYGEPDTKVEIEIRDENNKLNSIQLMRTLRNNGVSLSDDLPIAFLESESYFITSDIAYLSFNAFQPGDLQFVLHDLNKVFDSKGLIIDLRGNDGGSIEAMKKLLGRFISERKQYGKFCNRNSETLDYIEPDEEKYKGEMVVLIDEMSISGAENMAGIIQNWEIEKVIGNQSPGQMLVGEAFILNDSIVLSVPTYKLEYTNGKNPENNGINPDYTVSLKREDLIEGKDTQLEFAIDYLYKELQN